MWGRRTRSWSLKCSSRRRRHDHGRRRRDRVDEIGARWVFEVVVGDPALVELLQAASVTCHAGPEHEGRDS